MKDDNGTADREKNIVEVAQREIRKARAENGEEFVPKYFVFDEGSQSYRPLPNALKLLGDHCAGGKNNNNAAK